MSDTLAVLLVGGVAQTVTLALVLWAFEWVRGKRLRKQPGTIEHLSAEIERVERESKARDDVLLSQFRATEDAIKAHDKALVDAAGREFFDKMSKLMYGRAERKAFGQKEPE